MFGLTTRRVLLLAGLIALATNLGANGQIIIGGDVPEQDIPNASCGLSDCPPMSISFGFFEESWRRWPGESSTEVFSEALSPFTQPTLMPGQAPNQLIPEARDEDLTTIRKRQNDAGSAGGGIAPPAAETLPPTLPDLPADDLPADDLPVPDSRSDETPDDLDILDPFDDLSDTEPSNNDDAGGFFPSDAGDDASGLESGTDDLPEFQPDPSAPETSPEDDIFDLDDFSQSRPGPHRARRLQRPALTQRRAAPTRRPAKPQTRSVSVRKVQPTASTTTRGNPLRVRLAVNSKPNEFAVQPATRRSHPAYQAPSARERVRAIAYHEPLPEDPRSSVRQQYQGPRFDASYPVPRPNHRRSESYDDDSASYPQRQFAPEYDPSRRPAPRQALEREDRQVRTDSGQAPAVRNNPLR